MLHQNFTEVLNVLEGPIIVMKGALQSPNLNHLHGIAITSNVVVNSHSLSDLATIDLWHMRLAHMNEFGLTILLSN
jgi:hypothetical protein